MKRALLSLFLCMAAIAAYLPTEVQARPQGVQVLYYSRGVMERVFHVHETRRATGDYVPGLYRRHDADGLTAVNYNSRWMIRANVVLVVDLWDRVQQRWERHRLQVSDWQMRRDSTPYQRLEVDWNTAVSAHAVGTNTVARIIAISYP